MIDIVTKWSTELNTAAIFQRRDFKKVRINNIIGEGVELFETMSQRQYCIRARAWTLQEFGDEVEVCKAIGETQREATVSAMRKTLSKINDALSDRVVDSANYYATLDALRRDLERALADVVVK